MKSLLVAVVVSYSFSVLASGYNPSKIIGENDLVAVNADASNIPLKYKNLVNAFGNISMGCTGTHLGNGYVLTAGHCFWAGQELTKDLPCADVTVLWGMRQGVTPYLKSSCERVLFAQRNSINDFAIMKVSPVPTASVEVELNRKASPGDTLTIFSHPEDLPLRWSKTCVAEPPSDPKVSPDTLQHACDTNPGSSGATIIDANTLKIVGIHDGGRTTTPGVGVNYGTYITNPEIVNVLKELGFQ